MKGPVELVRLATAGSVDDGKSTLIGRLLFDSDSVYEDQIRAVEQASRQRGLRDIDLSLFTDGLQAEREQQITIDVAYRYFETAKRRFIVADVPGHEEYTRNMVTGASTADVSMLLIDARRGVTSQSRRHLFICSLLKIVHVLIVVNKMDAVDYNDAAFAAIQLEVSQFARRLSIPDLRFMPVSALVGDMVVQRGDNMRWYHGPTVLDYLDTVEVINGSNLVDMRLPIQYVIRPHHEFRGFAGRLASGIVRVGDRVVILPGGSTSSIASISVAGDEQLEARAGHSVVVTLTDEVDASRGSTLARTENRPTVAYQIEAAVCWFSTDALEAGRSYLLKHTTCTVRTYVDQLRYRINTETLHRERADALRVNEIGRVYLTSTTPLTFDPYDRNRDNGRFILIDEVTRETAGAGVIVRAREGEATTCPHRLVTRGAIVWFTGLPGSGKTTIAAKVADRLIACGVRVEQLDGDEFRAAFSPELGFSHDDRTLNIKRASLIAALLVKHGVIVLATFVSPARAHRSIVKRAAPDVFEIFVNTPLELCIQRDPKGMYREARCGTRLHFTGISDAYEPPQAPDLELKTNEITSEEGVDAVLHMLTFNRVLV